MDAMEAGAVSKGKRTKRQRLLFLTPPPLAIALPSTSSPEFSTGSTTEEEEDLANCLILLAQGRALDSIPKTEPVAEKFTSRRFAEATTTTTGKAGFYVYECKTCNKCFSSFQALGGHRASHKKPKLAVNNPEEKKVSTIDHGLELSMNSFMPPVTTTKSKIHECSICGSEFSSGQALGGHMRRHRPVSVSDSPDAKKERNLLSLDLNLPAPSEDDRGSEFSFSGKQLVMFSASSLVDCHY